MNNEEHLDPSISKLYQATPKAQPSAKIDVAILALAREKAPGKISKRQKMHYQRWWLPLSTAALLVMGVSVTIKIMHQPESMTQISVPLMAPMATPIAEQELKQDVDRPQALRQEPVKDEVEGLPSAAASMPTSAPTAAIMFEAEMDELSLDAQAVTKKEKRALAAKARARSSESRVKRAQMEDRALLKGAQPNRLPQASGTMTIQSDSVNEVISAPLSALPAEAVGSEQQSSSPEAWLNKINELLASGKKSEALIELKRFSSNHPDYPLPDALQRLLAAQ